MDVAVLQIVKMNSRLLGQGILTFTCRQGIWKKKIFKSLQSYANLNAIWANLKLQNDWNLIGPDNFLAEYFASYL